MILPYEDYFDADLKFAGIMMHAALNATPKISKATASTLVNTHLRYGLRATTCGYIVGMFLIPMASSMALWWVSCYASNLEELGSFAWASVIHHWLMEDISRRP